MRKTTFLLGLLCALLVSVPMQVKSQTYVSSGTPVSTSDELTTGRYLISVMSNGAEGLLFWAESLGEQNKFTVSATTAASKTGELDLSSDNIYMWDIVKADDGSFTIQSVKSGMFTSKMAAQGEGRHNTFAVAAGDDNIGTYAIDESVAISNVPHFIIRMTNGTFEGNGTTTYFHCNGSGTGTTGNNLHLSYWSGKTTDTNASCVKMAFYRVEAQAQQVTLTYEYQMNGTTVKTETVEAFDGYEFPDLSSLPAFCSATKPAGTVTTDDEGTTKVINVTWSAPFGFSATLEDENTQWYLMTLSQDNNSTNKEKPVVRYVQGQNYITLKSADNTFTYSTNDQWAFVGNPFDGFKIYNRAGGGARLISTTTMSGNEGRDTNPYVSTEALPSGFTELWDIHTQSTNGQQTAIDGGFAISQHGSPSYKLNNRAYGNDSGNDRRMAYWTGGSDNGSTFTVSQNLPAITLNEFEGQYYASFYVDYPVKSVSAPLIYTGTVSDGMLNMDVIVDESYKDVIPAEVGVVLVCASEPSNPIVPQICTEADAKLCAKPTSDLTGTTTDLDITDSQANYLVLGRSNETPQKLGFYQPTATTIPANKAYIDNTTHAVRGLAFNFSGEQTVIQLPTTTPADNQPVYDLSGRRVAKAAKGIYIQGGKKIYVK